MNTTFEEKWLAERRNVYSQMQDQFDQNARHSFKGCISAARILFGAYSAGDIDEVTLRTAVEGLKKVEEDNFGGAANLDVAQYLQDSRRYRETLKKKAEPLGRALGETRLLFIDDEYTKTGWNVVLDAICSKGKVLYADTGADGWEMLREHEPSISAVLLDMRLPSKPEEGIGVLKEIKEKHLDLPVIMFTAEDNSRFVKKCFQNGVFDYFVKELGSGDRSSLDYYLKLKEIVVAALSQRQSGGVWKRIRKLEDEIQQQGPPYYHDVIHYLRKAYVFLITDVDNWMNTMFLSRHNVTPYAEVIIQCALALEFVLDEILKKNKNHTVLKTLFSGGSLNDLTISPKIDLLQKIRVLSHDEVKRCKEINGCRIECVHPKRSGLRITEAAARRILNDSLDLLRPLILDKLIGVPTTFSPKPAPARDVRSQI